MGRKKKKRNPSTFEKTRGLGKTAMGEGKRLSTREKGVEGDERDSAKKSNMKGPNTRMTQRVGLFGGGGARNLESAGAPKGGLSGIGKKNTHRNETSFCQGSK